MLDYGLHCGLVGSSKTDHAGHAFFFVVVKKRTT